MTLTITRTGELSADTIARLEHLTDRRETIRAASRSDATLSAYRSDWRQLQTWGDGLGLEIPDHDALDAPLPVGVIEAYLLDRSDPEHEAQVTPQTLTRHLSAIRWWHRKAGHVSPTDHPVLEDTIAGIRRTELVRVKQARPVYLEDLRAMVGTLDDSPRGLRDRALLTVGWWGAFRRSELVGITTGDVEDAPQGLVVTLQRSKTDQEGRGRLVPLHYHPGDVCPVVALRRWSAGLEDGPVLRTVDRWGRVRGALPDRTVARVVKDLAAAVGLDPAGYSGHSLRAGFVSECDRRGIGTSAVRIVTGHQSDAMLNRYTRPRSLFESSAGAFFEATP